MTAEFLDSNDLKNCFADIKKHKGLKCMTVNIQTLYCLFSDSASDIHIHE